MDINQLTQKPLEERSDRELIYTRIILQREANSSLRSIKNTLQFFLWITIICIALAILIYIINESS
ncbi:hypothetical protein [Salinimicrobium sp. WS361]|uniref:hypothetical protein n=1 Tax=Salinimicrobium sp. WS361 TaxID=3425123 RepID=UPI003D6E0E27